MSSRIHSTFNRSTLRRLAGLRSFERGAQYALTGRVRKMKDADDEVTATVAGTRPYRVRLWVEEGGPAFSCTCPMGDEGAFCKHCVALGLTLLERGDTSLLSSPAEPATADLRPYLEAQDKEALVELVLAQAQEDELLRGRLLLEATKTAGTQVNLDGYRQAIDRVIMVDDYVDYRSMYDYAQGVEEVVESLEELLASRHAAEVIALTEHAMEAVEDALGRVDDSDGYLGGICDRLVKLHHAACLEARPDTPALAERLFGWGLNSEWETFLTAGADYADVLGEGRARGLPAHGGGGLVRGPLPGARGRTGPVGSSFPHQLHHGDPGPLGRRSGPAGGHQGARTLLGLSVPGDRRDPAAGRPRRGGPLLGRAGSGGLPRADRHPPPGVPG
ncbi:MAG: SWIM zinc finger family protein [Acidimicrobiia bacterium]